MITADVVLFLLGVLTGAIIVGYLFMMPLREKNERLQTQILTILAMLVTDKQKAEEVKNNAGNKQ